MLAPVLLDAAECLRGRLGGRGCVHEFALRSADLLPNARDRLQQPRKLLDLPALALDRGHHRCRLLLELCGLSLRRLDHCRGLLPELFGLCSEAAVISAIRWSMDAVIVAMSSPALESDSRAPCRLAVRPRPACANSAIASSALPTRRAEAAISAACSTPAKSRAIRSSRAVVRCRNHTSRRCVAMSAITSPTTHPAALSTVAATCSAMLAVALVSLTSPCAGPTPRRARLRPAPRRPRQRLPRRCRGIGGCSPSRRGRRRPRVSRGRRARPAAPRPPTSAPANGRMWDSLPAATTPSPRPNPPPAPDSSSPTPTRRRSPARAGQRAGRRRPSCSPTAGSSRSRTRSPRRGRRSPASHLSPRVRRRSGRARRPSPARAS